MKFKTILPLTALAILSSTSLSMATSFDEYVQKLSQHPQVESIIATSEASKAKAQGELGLPDPTLTFGVDNIPFSDPAFNRFLPSSKVIGITQKIPNPILLRAKSNMLDQISVKQKLMADYTKKRLRYMLITKLAEYESIKTQQKLIKKQLKFYLELEDTFKGQIESGRSVYQRFSEVDVERAEAERKLNSLEASKIAIESEFIRLVEEVPEIKIPEVLDNTWNKDENSLYPILIAAEDINISQKSVDIANAAFLPNFGINAIYKKREDGKNNSFSGDDWFSLKAQITIPLWASKNQKPKLQAAKDNARSAQFSYDNSLRTWIAKMNVIESARDAASKNVKVLQDKDHAMSHKIKASKRNYEAGTEDLDRVLLAQIDRLNIKAQLAQMKSMYISKSAEYNSNIVLGDN